MDKSTLSNYGWIVIAVLVLSVMIALATPFGQYIEQGVRSTTAGLFDTSEKALNVVGMSAGDGSFEDGYTSGQSTPAIDMSTVSSALENNSWATIQKVVKAGKVAEAGWSVGDTKTLIINGDTHTATIIGLDHDGENTATFMITEVGGIGVRVMNSDNTNIGGWEASAMRKWLRTDIYNSMTDVKDYIKPVTKMTNNTGYKGTTATATTDTLFLLSAKEVGIASWQFDDWGYPKEYKQVIEIEGTTYEWFTNGGYIDDCFWFRSPGSNYDHSFFYCSYGDGDLGYCGANYAMTVCPAFVIG